MTATPKIKANILLFKFIYVSKYILTKIYKNG